jgi:cardiolipin synthase
MTLLGAIIASIFVGQLILVFGFVLTERRQPAATLAWIMGVFFLPVVGAVLYLVFGMRRMVRHSERYEWVARNVEEALGKAGLLEGLKKLRNGADGVDRTTIMATLGSHVATLPPLAGNQCRALINGPTAYRAMFEAISAARHHVHVQFYVIKPDSTGRALRSRLIERAEAGVQVRVLTDGVGSFSLPNDFWEPLRAAGGQAGVFSPVSLLYRFRKPDRINYRNHRKIVVVDGLTGFTGGINIGAEYLSLDEDIGKWRDTHLQINGNAVVALQRTFAEDWLWATDELLASPLYYPIVGLEAGGTSSVQIIDSGPDRRWSPLQRLYVQAIALAQQRVWITSPYFIPGAVMEEALITASIRGLDVRILLPQKSDHPIVDLASKSHYARLLESGIKIYEYGRGFVHAKTLVVDEWVSSVGSANMDIRSFHLNFEANAFIYDEAFTRELASVFVSDLEDSKMVDLSSEQRVGYLTRLGRGFARLLSPLL